MNFADINMLLENIGTLKDLHDDYPYFYAKGNLLHPVKFKEYLTSLNNDYEELQKSILLKPYNEMLSVLRSALTGTDIESFNLYLKEIEKNVSEITNEKSVKPLTSERMTRILGDWQTFYIQIFVSLEIIQLAKSKKNVTLLNQILSYFGLHYDPDINYSTLTSIKGKERPDGTRYVEFEKEFSTYPNGTIVDIKRLAILDESRNVRRPGEVIVSLNL